MVSGESHLPSPLCWRLQESWGLTDPLRGSSAQTALQTGNKNQLMPLDVFLCSSSSESQRKLLPASLDDYFRKPKEKKQTNP